MQHDEYPPGFSDSCRLFPLPGLVLFPHAVLPLHIFEPRYRQMTEDALSTDNLITMVQIKPTPLAADLTEPPPIENMGCLGKIIRYQRLSDGRFNLLLVGLKRVRLGEELDAETLYRMASAEIVEDIPCEQPEQPARVMLIDLFRRGFDDRRVIDPDLHNLLDSDSVGLGALTDIVAHSLELSPALKQTLLAERSVDRRVKLLLEALGHRQDGRKSFSSNIFPPPFSMN